MALVSVVAPSVGGGVIESDVVASPGSTPLREVPLAAGDAGAGERIGEGSEPAASRDEPGFANGVVVVAAGADMPATASAVLVPAADDAADEVTTVALEVETVPLICVLVLLV